MHPTQNKKSNVLYEYTYHVAKNPSDLMSIAPYILKDICIGVDTETTSLQYSEQKIVSVQLAGNKHVVFVPILLGDVYDTPMIAMLQKIFQHMSEKKVTVSMHNAPFDLAALNHLYINWEGEVFCTMTAAHILNENRTKALKEIANSVFGTRVITYKDVSHLAYTDEEFIKYASHDAIFVRELHPIMIEHMRRMKQDALGLRIEMPFQQVLKDMRIHGIGVNPETAKKLAAQAKLLEYDLAKKCHTSAGLKFTEQCDLLGERFIQSKWNFNSSAQLIDIIENKLGFEIFETTDTIDPKTGKANKSVGKKTKARLKNQCEFVGHLNLYGKVSKLLSGFLEPFDQYVDPDGRIRSDFNNTGTVTGRPTSSDPNLFQLPKDNTEIDINFRECFVASSGKKLIAADFSGQELRGLADLTRDPSLLKCFERGMDLHLMVANEMFRLSIPEDDLCEKSGNYEKFKEKYKKERHIAKNGVLFPLIYGSTAIGISGNLGITVEEAQSHIDKFFNAFPMVKKCIDATRRFIIANGYVVNKSGRRRHFEKEYGKYNNSCFRQGFNFLIQGMAADMTKLACVTIRNKLRLRGISDAVIVLIVYDEVVVECKEADVDKVKHIMRDCMLNSYKLAVPLEVSMGIGDNYQQCK
jgi:DNA polymerase-1